MADRSEYNQIRNEITNGDIILFRGSSLLSRLIQYFDNAYYNHAGVVFASNNRLFILDANAHGVAPDFLSSRMKEYISFCIVRPNAWKPEQRSEALGTVMNKAERKIRYDFLLLLQIGIFRKTGIRIYLNNQQRDICSEFARRYLRFLVPLEKCYEKILGEDFITPWDLRIYASEQFKVLYDNSDKRKYRKVYDNSSI